MQTQAPDNEPTSEDGGGPLVLQAGIELTIPHVAELQQAWLGQLLAGPRDVTLELSAVEEFDSAGLQLLLALRNYQRTRGQALTVPEVPAVIVAALDVFGMTPAELGSPMATEALDVDS